MVGLAAFCIGVSNLDVNTVNGVIFEIIIRLSYLVRCIWRADLDHPQFPPEFRYAVELRNQGDDIRALPVYQRAACRDRSEMKKFLIPKYCSLEGTTLRVSILHGNRNIALGPA